MKIMHRTNQWCLSLLKIKEEWLIGFAKLSNDYIGTMQILKAYIEMHFILFNRSLYKIFYHWTYDYII